MKEERAVLRKLKNPAKIQNFVSALRWNFEPEGDECRTVEVVLRTKTAHCIEAAMVAAAAFMALGERPLLMDLKATDDDFDHVVALYKRNGKWGAISKSNHVYLRYRDPVYRTLRELAMSYFHEYFNTKGKKTLLSYSRPLDLSRYKPEEWITGTNAWRIAEDIDKIRHFPLISKKELTTLRSLEVYERDAYASRKQYKF
jgi:hypothetical protein